MIVMEREWQSLGVIVPTYNHGHFLRSTILSLLNQTYSNLKIVVVDDCSIDSTSEILKELGAEPRLSVIRNPINLGESESVNIGWAFLPNQYVAIVNSDDPQNLDWAQGMMNFIANNPGYVAYYPNLQIIDWHGNVTSKIELSKWNTKIATERLVSIASAGTVYNRKFLPDAFVPRYKFVKYPSDLIQILNISRFGKFKRVDNVHGTWRNSSEGLTATLGSVYKAEELHNSISYWLKQNMKSVENLSRLHANLYSQMWKLYRKELSTLDSISRLLKHSGSMFFVMPINQYNMCRAIFDYFRYKKYSSKVL
jgi:glycosyltransferase involved in cell wall biosynthesis